MKRKNAHMLELERERDKDGERMNSKSKGQCKRGWFKDCRK